MNLRLASIFVAACLLGACGGATTSPPDPSPGQERATDETDPGASSTPAGGPCVDGETKAPSGSSDGCFFATGHVCGDYSPPMVCSGGVFRCPSGTVEASECWCFGMGNPPASCACTPTGWSCPSEDGGASSGG